MKIKPSMLPAVEAPHPGASYNPAYEDYQVIEDILCNSVVCMNKTVSIHSISLFQYSCLYEKSVSIQQLVGII